MHKRFAAFFCLIALGLVLAGCTPCGWIWQDGQRACHSETPR